MGTTYDVYLMLRPFQEGVAEFSILLRPLMNLGRTQLDGVDGYYDAERDLALIGLRFHGSYVSRVGFEQVHATVEAPGLPTIVPVKLHHAERLEFYREILPRHNIYVQHYPYEGERVSVIEQMIHSLVAHRAPIADGGGARPFEGDYELPAVGDGAEVRYRAVTLSSARALERALSPGVERLHARALSPAIGGHQRALSPGF
ncbi:MAG: hypothetical protein Tsb0020_21530 [Haliangiales bacterium]